MADIVIDMHSGGRGAWFIPCSHMHVVDDPVQRKAMLEGMEAWNSEEFQAIRAAHLRRDVKGTVCEECVAYGH